MIETGQLRWWTAGLERGPFIVLEYDPVGAGAWWILGAAGKDWVPDYELKEFSEVLSEA